MPWNLPQGLRRCAGPIKMRVHRRLATRGLSSALPKCYNRGSVKSQAVQILSDAHGDILPLIKRSFVNREYSPLTGMDRSEWEIML
jgi:hypothetical protein